MSPGRARSMVFTSLAMIAQASADVGADGCGISHKEKDARCSDRTWNAEVFCSLDRSHQQPVSALAAPRTPSAPGLI